MTTQATFDACNAVGRKAEERLANVFLLCGWSVKWRPRGASRDLEVVGPHGTELVEVKCEDAQDHTGNLCIELYQGLAERRYSGLMLSESTVCVHTFGPVCVAYRTQAMRLYIQTLHAEGRMTPAPFARSDNGAGGVLIPRRAVVAKRWAEELSVARLPQSRVFKA